MSNSLPSDLGGEEMKRELDRIVLRLHELGYDAVQIMCSFMHGGRTLCLKAGAGNFYARKGMAEEFIEHDIASDLASEISSALNPPDDDDSWKEEVDA